MKSLSVLSITILAILLPSSANAASFLRICTATGNCRICDIVASAITLGQWLITGAAGLALLVIVWAAFGMITSVGNAEKTGESKKQIKGAIFGMAITMVSFQLISWIIFAFVVPSDLNTSRPTLEQGIESRDRNNLKHLLGTPWWSICDERDLRKKAGKADGFGATANCKYWGDGTVCSQFKKSDNKNSAMKICFNGECIDLNSEKEKTKLDEYLKKMSRPKKDSIKNACDFLAAVDFTYEDYKCLKHDTSSKNPADKNCDTTKTIEKGFCPGDKTIVCCVQK